MFKIAALTAALYALFHAALRGNTFFRFNRCFLSGGMLLAVVLPFIPFVYEPDGNEPARRVAENLFQIGPLAARQVDTGLAARSGKIFTCLYGAGVAVLLLARYLGIRTVRRFIKEGKRTVFSGYTLVESPSAPASFSYLRYIIVPARLNEANKRIILTHEKAHVAQRHYIDLFASELFCILQWFNPFAWLYKRDLVENQEFLADRCACRICGIEAYKAALTGCWMYGTGGNLINPFARFTRLVRLSMLTQPASPALRKWRALGLIPLVAVYACLFAVPASQAVPVSGSGQITVTGTVSAKTGRKLAEAALVIPGKAQGTLSDPEGRYQLSVDPGDFLRIQMPGYESQQIRMPASPPKTGTVHLDIILQPVNK